VVLFVAMRIPANKHWRSAFTLAEVVMTTGLAAIVIGGSVYGYVTAAQRAEWAAYSLAAHSLAMQRVEQCRAAKWDPLGFPPVDELVATNFPQQINTLDIPVSQTNVVYATNFTVISVVSTNPLLKMIRVDCCWTFMRRGPFTNTVVTYRAPDQ
jgi:hypothetical protein